MITLTNRKRVVAGVVLTFAATVAGVLYRYWDQLTEVVGLSVNLARSSNQPPGTLTVETARPAQAETARIPAGSSANAEAPSLDWSSYNRTLTSERYSPLSEINRDNLSRLRVLCTYDTKEHTSFETGPLMVQGSLIATTEHDIFSIDPATCHENWRTHEDYVPASVLRVNRGAAYLDGLLFRGSEDGRVLAYNFHTGKRVWETTIANAKLGETTPSAPIAWNGMVFIGNAGGDYKGVKGRMYALEAKTGKIAWEFYLVPKGPDDPMRGPQGATPLDTSTWGNRAGTPITGGGTWTSYSLDPIAGELYVPSGNPAPDFAIGPREGQDLYTGSVVVLDAATGVYKRHFKVVVRDWHDWDVSSAPALIHTKAGKRLMAVAPKNGYLYGFDLDSSTLLYRIAVTRVENTDEPLSTNKAVHFCPGVNGGSEWNGPAYDPQTNLIVVGEDDWCTAVTVQTDAQIQAVERGQAWPGMATTNPYHMFGILDPISKWAGWVYAVDADTGAWKWRAKSNYPVMSAVTPTAGGIVFFGDAGGNLYALESTTGKRLWGKSLDGGIGGGIITYSVGGSQKVAVAAGFTNVLWPTKVATGKIVILGISGA